MNLRRDSLAAAAEIMVLIEAVAAETSTSVGTVGQLDLEPGGINIISGKVRFSLDFRDIDEGVRDQVEGRILEGCEKVCRRRNVRLKIETLQRLAPTPARSWSRSLRRGPARGWASVPILSPAVPDMTGCSSRTSARWA